MILWSQIALFNMWCSEDHRILGYLFKLPLIICGFPLNAFPSKWPTFWKEKKKKNTYQFRWDIEEGENLTLKLYLEIKYFNVFCLKGYLVCAVKPVVNQRGGLISIISLSTNLQVPVLCTSIHKIKDKIISLNICFVQIISLQILRISFLMGIWLSKALHLQKYATS